MAAVVRIHGWPRPVALLVETLLVAGCYYGAGRLGLLLQLVVEGAVVTPLWPPTGVAVACLLIRGPRCLPGIALGSLLVVMSLTTLRPTAVGIVAGNTAAPACAYVLLRAVGFRLDLSRLRDGLALVFLGALTAMVISSGVGVGVILSTGRLDTAHFWTVWLAWWAGDAMGVVIVTPLLLLLYRARLPPPTGRWREAVGLTLALCVLVPLVTRSSIGLMFLVFPLLIWAALRFELAGSMPCALLASVLVTITASTGSGSFGRLSPDQVMIKLQAFNGAIGLTALLLSSVITEQHNTRRSVERACQELVEALQHLSAGSGRRQPGQDGD
ncbi:MASE1 domain-containing protein [Streptomyces tagetis]|uniref:MASE1 domain-containing protein n=1 Tax=Streptomyces tagetis TaxID=2820809 RepID=A0A940XFE0_9ACTN|nr:MASE1 domain-containing protein [Streptomyces sp. RG38]MBQ0826462.1 MASE1 domain-containing protein [Streptomyces sp. RG38]